mmetsp:Transcript_20218/g.34440  ORF Transcript_20218/g.34440 Transcript_20218/m.34440 type:complete len:499 (+) Transcript_20218:76-1572(+)
MSSTTSSKASNKRGGGSNNPKRKNTTNKKSTKPKQITPDPPLECTQEDFDALLQDASELADFDEASSELIDCARYGEVDACRAILDVWSKKQQATQTIVNAIDNSQSTPLHKAAANGHLTTVQLLLSRGADHLQNDSGNTPLHWAAASGHAEVVNMILSHYDATAKTSKKNKPQQPLDVLLKNNFGRSALTEGFQSGDTKTVEHLLNHDSAEEERLIGGLDGKAVDDDEMGVDDSECGEAKKSGGDSGKKSIVHEFDFLRDCGVEDGPCVSIRELPIAHADNPFGAEAIEDTTGLGIWCASLVMARWLASPSMVERMRSKTILELGAGCGIPALAAAVHGKPKSVLITDLNPQTIDNIRHNIELNQCNDVSTGSSIDWGDVSTWPSEKLDYVICSDCIYQKDIVPLLKKVVTGLLKCNDSDCGDGGGSFLYVAPDGGRDGLPEFIAAMKSEGFECVKEEIAPDEYRRNPLKSGDEEDCFLHFHELSSTVYVLYEFKRC